MFFTLGGADANENAVKIARQARGKPRGNVIARDRSYHGASYATMALSGDTRHQSPGRRRRHSASCTPRRPMPIAARSAARSREDCGERGAAARRRADRPSRRRAGRRRADGAQRRHQRHRRAGQLLAAAARATRERGVYLIADEVMSGFGRCGEWFAWQRHGEAGRPDLMTLAKGLTGAHLPLGAVVMSARDRARDSKTRCLHGPDLLRTSAVLRGGRCRGRGVRGRGPDRALAQAWARRCSRELQKLQERHRDHRRRARRPRPVRRRRAGARPRIEARR